MEAIWLMAHSEKQMGKRVDAIETFIIWTFNIVHLVY